MRHYSSRPGWRGAVNRMNIQNLFRMLQYQLLCDIDQALNFFEVRVLVDFQIRHIIWSKMNGCFHWRRHEHFPFQHICLWCFHWKCWVTCCNSQLSLVGNGRSSSCFDGFCTWYFEILSLESLSVQASLYGQGTKIFLCHLVSKDLNFELFLVSFFENFRLLGFVWSPYKFPCSSLTTLSFVGILPVDQTSLILRRIFPRAQRTAYHQVDGSRLCWNHWYWFRHRWTFTGSRFWISLWHGPLLSDRTRKKIAEMAARENRETHHVEQTKKMVPLVTRETLFRLSVSKLVFGVHIFDFDLRFLVNSVEQPIKRNSVVSGHVSHCWTSSFDNHFDDSFVVFRNVQLRLAFRRMCVLVGT